MGLMLSVLIECVGVLEVIAYLQNFAYGLQIPRYDKRQLVDIKHHYEKELLETHEEIEHLSLDELISEYEIHSTEHEIICSKIQQSEKAEILEPHDESEVEIVEIKTTNIDEPIDSNEIENINERLQDSLFDDDALLKKHSEDDVSAKFEENICVESGVYTETQKIEEEEELVFTDLTTVPTEKDVDAQPSLVQKDEICETEQIKEISLEDIEEDCLRSSYDIEVVINELEQNIPFETITSVTSGDNNTEADRIQYENENIQTDTIENIQEDLDTSVHLPAPEEREQRRQVRFTEFNSSELEPEELNNDNNGTGEYVEEEIIRDESYSPPEYVVDFILPGNMQDEDLRLNDVGSISNEFGVIAYDMPLFARFNGSLNREMNITDEPTTDDVSELSMFTETELSAAMENIGMAASNCLYYHPESQSFIEIINEDFDQGAQHDMILIEGNKDDCLLNPESVFYRPPSPFPFDELHLERHQLKIPESLFEVDSNKSFDDEPSEKSRKKRVSFRDIVTTEEYEQDSLEDEPIEEGAGEPSLESMRVIESDTFVVGDEEVFSEEDLVREYITQGIEIEREIQNIQSTSAEDEVPIDEPEKKHHDIKTESRDNSTLEIPVGTNNDINQISKEQTEDICLQRLVSDYLRRSSDQVIFQINEGSIERNEENITDATPQKKIEQSPTCKVSVQEHQSIDQNLTNSSQITLKSVKFEIEPQLSRSESEYENDMKPVQCSVSIQDKQNFDVDKIDEPKNVIEETDNRCIPNEPTTVESVLNVVSTAAEIVNNIVKQTVEDVVNKTDEFKNIIEEVDNQYTSKESVIVEGVSNIESSAAEIVQVPTEETKVEITSENIVQCKEEKHIKPESICTHSEEIKNIVAEKSDLRDSVSDNETIDNILPEQKIIQEVCDKSIHDKVEEIFKEHQHDELKEEAQIINEQTKEEIVTIDKKNAQEIFCDKELKEEAQIMNEPTKEEIVTINKKNVQEIFCDKELLNEAIKDVYVAETDESKLKETCHESKNDNVEKVKEEENIKNVKPENVESKLNTNNVINETRNEIFIIEEKPICDKTDYLEFEDNIKLEKNIISDEKDKFIPISEEVIVKDISTEETVEETNEPTQLYEYIDESEIILQNILNEISDSQDDIEVDKRRNEILDTAESVVSDILGKAEAIVQLRYDENFYYNEEKSELAIKTSTEDNLKQLNENNNIDIIEKNTDQVEVTEIEKLDCNRTYLLHSTSEDEPIFYKPPKAEPPVEDSIDNESYDNNIEAYDSRNIGNPEMRRFDSEPILPSHNEETEQFGFNEAFLNSLDGIKFKPLTREDGSWRRKNFRKKRSSSSSSSKNSKTSREEELKMLTSLEETEQGITYDDMKSKSLECVVGQDSLLQDKTKIISTNNERKSPNKSPNRSLKQKKSTSEERSQKSTSVDVIVEEHHVNENLDSRIDDIKLTPEEKEEEECQQSIVTGTFTEIDTNIIDIAKLDELSNIPIQSTEESTKEIIKNTKIDDKLPEKEIIDDKVETGTTEKSNESKRRNRRKKKNAKADSTEALSTETQDAIEIESTSEVKKYIPASTEVKVVPTQVENFELPTSPVEDLTKQEIEQAETLYEERKKMRILSKVASFEDATDDQHHEILPRRLSMKDNENASGSSIHKSTSDSKSSKCELIGGKSSVEGAFWLIFSGEYTKAMNKDWHGTHFCCWQCDESLTGQRYVLRDDHPYCVACYESVFANACEECNKTIGIDSKDLSYKDKHWHEACFLCTKCRVSLVDKQFGSKLDKIYCGNCYDAQFASRCDGCGEIFRAGTKKMEYKTRQWHEKCFCCCVCKTAIGTKSFIPREQEIYCAQCYEEKFATRCVKCNKIITSGGVTYKNEPWHRECFTCSNCSTSLAGQRFTSRDDKPYCADCFGELFAKRCTACSKPITGIGGTRFISFEERHWHNDCFVCASCRTSLVGRGFITDEQDIICPECAKQKLM